MGTTPIYGFPYPDPSDLVANYPALGQQLAEDVETEIAASSKVLQVLSAAKTDTFSTSSTSLADVTGLSVAITPATATNKILVTVHINAAVDNSAGGMFFAILRGATQIALGDAAGSRLQRTFPRFGSPANGYTDGTLSMTFLDSPATTSATTYKLQANVTSATTGFINRTVTDTDSNNNARGISSITVMEISA
jgi:hypothetical protein